MANKEMAFNCCDSNRRFVCQSRLLAARPRAHQKEELIRVLTVGESLLKTGSDMLNVGGLAEHIKFN